MYVYDHDGVRVSQEAGDGSSETTYLIDKQNPTGYAKSIEDRVDGTLQRSYVLGHSVEAQADDVGTVYLIKDGHGSTRLLVDQSGATISGSTFIDAEGRFVESIDAGEMQPGLNKSLDFAELKVQSRAPLIHPPRVVFRAQTLKRIGPADSPHSRTTSDMNHWYRAVLDSDVYFIPKVLTQYRQHTGTDTHVIHQQMKALGCYTCTAENADLLAHQLRSERAADPEYRRWLSDRLIRTHALRKQRGRASNQRLPAPFPSLFLERRDCGLAFGGCRPAQRVGRP